MLSFLRSWLPGVPGLWPLSANPLDCLLQGLVASCGISVLCNLMRIHLYIGGCSAVRGGLRGGGLLDWAVLWVLTGLLALVGPRVAALLVLEFSLRAVSARVAGQQGPGGQLLVQCQFSLGCALTCSLSFLQEGAAQRTLGLVLAAGLAGLLSWCAQSAWRHVGVLYPLHSSQRYCGLCLTLLSHGCSLPRLLRRALSLCFLVADIAAVALVNRDFLSTGDALRFWTPLTICYTLLVVYMQEEQQQRPGEGVVFRTAGVRLGGLLVLMLTVGRWTDVLDIGVCLLGEACCLLTAGDMLSALRAQDIDDPPYRSSVGRQREAKRWQGHEEVTQPRRKDL